MIFERELRESSSPEMLRVPLAQATFLLQSPGSQNRKAVYGFGLPFDSLSKSKLKRASFGALFSLMAGVEGIEPPTAVLETAVIPLN